MVSVDVVGRTGGRAAAGKDAMPWDGMGCVDALGESEVTLLCASATGD